MNAVVLPAIGPVYRDRRDGTYAAAIAGPILVGFVLVRTAAGDRLWLTLDGFFGRYIHRDLYDTERN